MNYPVRFLVRRWWWSKWHPAVRMGWMVTRSNGSGSQAQTMLGIGLIAAGIVLRSRRSLHLYSATVDPGRSITIRNATPDGG